MATLTTIAQNLGVSEATVSNALSGKGRMKEDTRERILKEAEQNGYKIQHSIKCIIKKVIIVTEEFSENCNPFINGLCKCTRESDLFWPVYNLDIWERRLPRDVGADVLRPLLNSLIEQLPFRLSGMVYISQYPRNIPGLFTGLNIPVVGIQLMNSGADAYVNFDNQQGAYEAVRYLAKSGKSQIATLSGSVDTYTSSERMIGYQRALIDSSLTYHPKLIWIGDWSEKSGYHLMQHLLEMSEPPDAIFAQNDGMAKGALDALREKGVRVPEDIAVIGFDDTNFASFLSPALSSIQVPRFDMGVAAYQIMCDLLKKKKVQDAILPCKLMLRESC